MLDIKHVTSLISEIKYHTDGKCATTCYLNVGDAVIVGHSFSFENYDKKLGEEYAYEDAIDKLFELEAYHLKRIKGESFD